MLSTYWIRPLTSIFLRLSVVEKHAYITPKQCDYYALLISQTTSKFFFKEEKNQQSSITDRCQKMENMIVNLGYWSKASVGTSIGVSTFLFFNFGDCLAFFLPLTLELTAILKD